MKTINTLKAYTNAVFTLRERKRVKTWACNSELVYTISVNSKAVCEVCN